MGRVLNGEYYGGETAKGNKAVKVDGWDGMG